MSQFEMDPVTNQFYPFDKPCFTAAVNQKEDSDCWTGKTVIVEFYIKSSIHCYPLSINLLRRCRAIREYCLREHLTGVRHLDFMRFDLESSDLSKQMAEFVEPPLPEYPTYICFENGIEKDRPVISNKPADRAELVLIVQNWMDGMGFEPPLLTYLHGR